VDNKKHAREKMKKHRSSGFILLIFGLPLIAITFVGIFMREELFGGGPPAVNLVSTILFALAFGLAGLMTLFKAMQHFRHSIIYSIVLSKGIERSAIITGFSQTNYTMAAKDERTGFIRDVFKFVLHGFEFEHTDDNGIARKGRTPRIYQPHEIKSFKRLFERGGKITIMTHGRRAIVLDNPLLI